MKFYATNKKVASIDEQINILISRGLSIKDRWQATKLLSNVSYYTLIGYLDEYKDADNMYQQGLDFSMVNDLYQFDGALQNLLLDMISTIEQLLKTRMAHEIANTFPDNLMIYLEKTFFKDQEAHKIFSSQINMAISRDKKVPYIKDSLKAFGGKLPIWVAVDLMTVGNVQHLYLDLPNRIRRRISSQLDLSPIVLDSWLENLRITRNMLAHQRRLYNTTWQLIPKLSSKLISERFVNNRIFTPIFMFKQLFPDDVIWNKKIAQLEILLHDYADFVTLLAIGFSNDWLELLKK